jgi:20S proteasome subunit alpha 2
MAVLRLPTISATLPRRFVAFILFSFSFLLLFHHVFVNGSSGAYGSGGRHSYSLTTFDPSGNLDQVGRAVRASMLGAPVVALSITSSSGARGIPAESRTSSSYMSPSSLDDGIYICLPLRFLGTASSPLIIDDGTPRIVPISSSMCICHTGVGADGRALSENAVRLALDYRYVYGEEIPSEEILEALAEKVQEMTMKAGSRPYGCALLVACLGATSKDAVAMYRIDPSGSVNLLNANNNVANADSGGMRPSVAFLGNWKSQKEDEIRSQLDSQQYTNEEHVQDALINAIESNESITTPSSSKSNNGGGSNQATTYLYASFTHKSGLRISRIIREKGDDASSTS